MQVEIVRSCLGRNDFTFKIFGIDSIIYPKLKHRILLVGSLSEAKASCSTGLKANALGLSGELAIQSKFGLKAKASGSFDGLVFRS